MRPARRFPSKPVGAEQEETLEDTACNVNFLNVRFEMKLSSNEAVEDDDERPEFVDEQEPEPYRGYRRFKLRFQYRR